MQKILKNKKGSISLFVLLSALFFLVVVTSVGISYKNKERSIDSKLEKIKMSYEKDAEQVYNEAVSNNDWVYDHATQTVTKGKLTLKIGDYVNTTPYTVDGKQFDGKWRVLGEENGQLLLVSANYVDFQGSINQSGVPEITLQGSNGIDNEIDRLNTLSAKFADGTKTEKGRSIKVEDVNRITGYDPTNSRINPTDLTKKGLYGENIIYQYGNNVTYTIKSDGKVWYKGDQAATEEGSGIYTKFLKLGESSNITEPFTIKSTW